MSNSVNFELISNLNPSLYKEFEENDYNNLFKEEMEMSQKSSSKISSMAKEEGKKLEEKINSLLGGNKEKLKAFEYNGLDEKRNLEYDEIEISYSNFI